MQAVYKDGNDDEGSGSIHVEGQGTIGGRIGGESALAEEEEEEEEHHYNNVIPFAFHCSQRSHQVVMTSSPPSRRTGKSASCPFCSCSFSRILFFSSFVIIIIFFIFFNFTSSTPASFSPLLVEH
jgi:hypothetical protein